MMRTLILAEHNGLTLKDEFYKTLSAAIKIGGEIDVFIIGCQCEAVSLQAAKLNAISQVFLVDDVAYCNSPEEKISALLHYFAKDYTHLICSASSFGKNIFPRIAAYFNVAQISGVSDVIAEDVFIRPIYAGNLLTKVKSNDAIKIITVVASAFLCSDELKPAGSLPSSVNRLSVDMLPSDILAGQQQPTFVSERKSIYKRKSLQAARVVVSAGRGLSTQENFDALELLADKLDAAIGATRAVVDAGWLQNDRQIGQTARVVAPMLYVALGVSGAAQHLAGMKNSKIIIAVNKDSTAPIFQVANYGLVADVNDVLPALLALL
jgi:electron transfer flavoprotein alpha subunit